MSSTKIVNHAITIDIFRDGCRQITWLLVLGQLVRVSRAPVTQIVIWIVAYQSICYIPQIPDDSI